MLISMTGYGKSYAQTSMGKFIIEIKSINGRFLDLSIDMPLIMNEKEMIIRKYISQHLERGTINVTITSEYEKLENLPWDEDLLPVYYIKLKKWAKKLCASDKELFTIASIMSIKNNSKGKNYVQIPFGKWQNIKASFLKALTQCKQYRANEGKVLQKKIEGYINNIKKQLRVIIQADRKRNRKKNVLSVNKEIDISEEITRLEIHLRFFEKTLQTQSSGGKKLGFITQEMLREMNTIGSKASNATIRRNVINAKDDLEKIKEQLNNVV